MKRRPLKRPNPYQDEGLNHKPTLSNSPYEKTLSEMFGNQRKIEMTPKAIRFCGLCSDRIDLNSSGTKRPSSNYPSASGVCHYCDSDICHLCTRICEMCDNKICYVCISAKFTETHSFDLCPACFN